VGIIIEFFLHFEFESHVFPFLCLETWCARIDSFPLGRANSFSSAVSGANTLPSNVHGVIIDLRSWSTQRSSCVAIPRCSLVFFIPCYIFFNYFIANIFTAVVLDRFQMSCRRVFALAM
jgi:hypothetical protein